MKVILMKCEWCKGEGYLIIVELDDKERVRCYGCEGSGEVEICPNCHGACEGLFRTTSPKRTELDMEWKPEYEYRPCMTCIGNGIIPKRMKEKKER
jgi:hypothetical protein